MDLIQLFKQYRYPIAGGLLGLILALLLVSYGFLKTLIILIFISAGIYGSAYLKKTGILDHLK
ncbi:DUF2273 domain-containing protein [Streptococcus chenjunshii]|uniref:DUF2273 domain-containing protein n=1 Tax=Streptococcus chenjunshii TaxID=2173853 RepID=A0A372KNQ8_9STRE|nr:DUF2273 domain-containing protein [Streptococcus chenjunshii]RFU51815.1 DUF2273 domain-containing protein [Streptococcus chenjunshii]RFU53903.1 DUF2273 domain-containing protein [Streptococcus chenjunshii]